MAAECMIQFPPIPQYPGSFQDWSLSTRLDKIEKQLCEILQLLREQKP